MTFKWLHQTCGASHVIVFFNGWGLDESVVSNLGANGDFDVLVVSNYTDLNTELPDLSHYETRILVAWSFGVANYTAWQQNRPDRFDVKIAINGTMLGIDRHFGIAKPVVKHTIDTLSADSFIEFSNRCYNLKKTITSTNNLDISEKKQELQRILDRNYLVDNDIQWNAIWISLQDKIFPPKNQQSAWQQYQTNLIDAAHAPFQYWNNWLDLLPISK